MDVLREFRKGTISNGRKFKKCLKEEIFMMIFLSLPLTSSNLFKLYDESYSRDILSNL